MSEDSLSPCPMCDAPARFVWSMRDETFGRVKCTRPSCGTQSGAFDHRSNAINAWNARVTPPDLLAALDEIMRPYGIYDCFVSEQSSNPRLSEFVAAGKKARAAIAAATSKES